MKVPLQSVLSVHDEKVNRVEGDEIGSPSSRESNVDVGIKGRTELRLQSLNLVLERSQVFDHGFNVVVEFVYPVQLILKFFSMIAHGVQFMILPASTFGRLKIPSAFSSRNSKKLDG